MNSQKSTVLPDGVSKEVEDLQYYDHITDFIFVDDIPDRSDIIFVPGGSYPEIALLAAKLYHQQLSPLILPSGKYSITAESFMGVSSMPKEYLKPYQTEWEFLTDVILSKGVPGEAVLKEDKAGYTYENAIFSREVTDHLNIKVDTAIICCQAYHARRSLMYYQLLYPDTLFYVCPAVTQGISRDNWFLQEDKIDKVLGEVERCGSQFHDIMKSGILERV